MNGIMHFIQLSPYGLMPGSMPPNSVQADRRFGALVLQRQDENADVTP
jgi:hypothetical protein